MENNDEVLDRELRRKYVKDLYLLGVSRPSIAQSLGCSIATIGNDCALISEKEKEGQLKHESDVLKVQLLALKEFSSDRYDAYKKTMYKALRHHLDIGSLLIQLQGVAHTMNILSDPELSSEARPWYDMFRQEIFGWRVGFSKELIFETYLMAIREDADLLPDTRDGLLMAITDWFVKGARGSIMPISLSDDFVKDAHSVLESLSSRERDVTKLYFGLGMAKMSLREIGQQFGVTDGRIQQIKEKILRKLRNPDRNKNILGYFQSSADISQAVRTLQHEAEELKRQRQEFEKEKKEVVVAVAVDKMIERASLASIIDISFEKFGFSTRICHCLERSNIRSIPALLKKSGDELLNRKNFGVGCLKEVKEKLALHGLQLRQEEAGEIQSTGDHAM